MTPHAAYMQTLGLETLQPRYAVHEANARKVAEGLESFISDLEKEGRIQPGEMSVCWPGLESNPYHDLAKEQFEGHYSAMITLTLPDEESCFRFIDGLKTVRRATNLFDNRTLAIHPASTIFGTIDAATRAEMDVSDRLIRLSIGLEDSDDLLADIKQAMTR